MSVQFGKCNFDRKPVDPRDLGEVRPVLAPYGPDREGYICQDNVAILYCAFHTTAESHLEIQPHVSASGTVVTWDGRLDNRDELIGQLRGEVGHEPTDAEIVAAALDRWHMAAFRLLIGDWALSAWQPKQQLLILARDFLGTRHLFYSADKDQVTWCTILDPLVRLAGHAFELEEEYLAGWLSFFPASHLTPYRGIQAVPPASFVQFSRSAPKIVRYWDFDGGSRICYRTDTEYEEHFRAVFSSSVRRRLRSDRLVLAELSGGMDSSSIVCVADDVLRKSKAETVGLDTVSYYDDSEPNWNERPYFNIVELRRGRAGYHIDTSSREPLEFRFADDTFAATPSAGGQKSDARKAFDGFMNLHGARVLLSGIGGDEVTGGVPTPIPELADLVVGARIRTLAHRLKLWALEKKMPWFFLLYEVIRKFLPPFQSQRPEGFPGWLQPGFVQRNRAALLAYEKRLTLTGVPPSFQETLSTVDILRRQLGSLALPMGPTYETRYPFLDRDLLEFLLSVPPEQLVRPGQRRSLIRRALADTVPQPILARRRKAFVVRGPSIAASMLSNLPSGESMLCSEFGIVDEDLFAQNLALLRKSCEIPIVPLARTLLIESWLKHVIARRVLRAPASARSADGSCRPVQRSVAANEKRFNPAG